MSDIAIKVENLTKIYPLYKSHKDRFKEAMHPIRKKYHQDFYALNNINFEIKKGETVGIIGQNGSGKSTLLKIITGVLTPTSGSVTVNGRVSSLLELGTGFNPEYTGMENVFFFGVINGLTRPEMEKKLDSILSFADIGEFIHQPVKMYSSGMFVRLAFACAIQIDPDILIVDEALAVGDMFFQQKCILKLRKMMQLGITILFVSHSHEIVNSLCNRGILLEHGIIKMIGNAKDVTLMYFTLLHQNQDLSNELEIDNKILNKEFKNFLVIAKGSNGEFRSQLYRCLNRNHINKEKFDELYAKMVYKASLMNRIPKYVMIQPSGKRQKITVAI